jgi:DNA-binding NarL/FixJ family response regulator
MAGQRRERALVVQDRSRLFREGLASLLAADEGWTVVALCSSPDELRSVCQERHVDVVLAESVGPTDDLRRLVDDLRSEHPEVRVVGTLPAWLHPHPGAKGLVVVPRVASLEEFRRVLGPDDEAPEVAGESRRRRVGAAPGGLTTGELQVLALISARLGTEEIAARLRISANTVERRRERIYAKLGVQSQAQAMTAAFRSGLLGPPQPSGPTEATRARPGPGYLRPSVRVHRFVPGLPRVVVVHDHRWVAQVLGRVMAGSIDLVGDTAYGEVALALCDLVSPDVVVVSDMVGEGVIDHFLQPLVRTGARLLVVTEPLDTGRACDLVERGVMGIVDFNSSPGALSDAILAVAFGGSVLPSQVIGSIVGDWRIARRSRAPESATALTTREREVLNALADGLSTKAVARLLGIAVKTVENHKTRIFDKLGVKTQFQAVALLLEGRVVVEDAAASVQRIVE